jgi:hypothetical protein
MRRARTQRPEHFTVDLGHPRARGAVFLGLGRAHHSPRYRDESGKGNHGTLTNMDPLTDWVFDPKLGRWTLDIVATASQYVYRAGAVLNGFPATMACWVRGVSTSCEAMCLHQLNPANQIGYYLLLKLSSGAARFVAYHGGSSAAAMTTNTIGAGVWGHLCAIAVSPTERYVYLNANLLGRGTSTAEHDITGSLAHTFLGVGRDGYGTGRLADALFYNRVLSLPEIAALADPSNVMLSGLVVPPRRRLCVIGAAAGGGITGTGTVAAQPAALAGTGAETFAGTGTVAGSPAALAGTGALKFLGAGAVAAPPAALAGTGVQVFSGAGAIAAQLAALAGTGVQVFSGAGAIAAQLAALAGAGALKFLGAGAVAAPPAALAGTGALKFLGAGAVAARPAALAGTGVTSEAAFFGPGAVAAFPAAIAGEGIVEVFPAGNWALIRLAGASRASVRAGYLRVGAARISGEARATVIIP